MRTATTLVGLSLFALAGTARAQEAASAPASAGASVGEAAATPAPAAAGPAATAAAPAPVPAPVIAASAEQPASARKIHVGVAFLPMGLGKYKYSEDALNKKTTDAAFAYGVGLSAGYEVLPNFIVGLAPQVIFNVKEKAPTVAASSESATQYDLLARLAYMLPITEGTSVYAEVLPGYSIIKSPATPVGFVVGFGAGMAMEMTDRFFVNLGVGYQLGFQTWKAGANTYDNSTRYLRIALGGGIKF